jgi:hypothetical protein
MFSRKLRYLLPAVLVASGTVAASGANSADPDIVAPPAVLDTGRYVQTELDWRSYYLNRPVSQRTLRVQPAENQPPLTSSDGS